MSDILLSALINGLFLILGAGITHLATKRQKDLDNVTRQLKQTLADIKAFHNLEERYTQALTIGDKTIEKSALAWKLAVRKQQRDSGIDTPVKQLPPTVRTKN